MSAFQELFIGLNRIITPLTRLFEESETDTSHVSAELYRFYQKVINEVFVLIGTCFLDKYSLKGLKKHWEKKLCHNVYTNNTISKLHPTLPYRNTNLGLTLLECLREMSDERNLKNELQAKILSLFDIGIVQAFKKDYRETTSFRATLIHHFVHPSLYVLICRDFNIRIGNSRFYIKEVTIYVHGGKSSSIGINCADAVIEDPMLHDNWIIETNDKFSPFIVCQYGMHGSTLQNENENPINLTLTHGILHSGSFEVVFSAAEGEVIKKCHQAQITFNN